MLISEFSRATGLSPDTVRFTVKRGLLKPETGRRGGANPYQVFRRDHLEMARLVKLAQSLGFTLREIAALANELAATGFTRRRKISILRGRLDVLDEKAEQIADLRRYLTAKIAWIEGGDRGPEPALDAGNHAPAVRRAGIRRGTASNGALRRQHESAGQRGS